VRLVYLLGLLGIACGRAPEVQAIEPPPRARRDVLLITIDTLRSDFLSCYGFPRRTTPALDRLASQGVLFEQHRTVVPLTLPSHTTLFSGRMPSEHGVTRNDHHVPAALPMLAEILQRAGYRTCGVVWATVLERASGVARGFELFDDEMGSEKRRVGARGEFFERSAERVVAQARALLAEPDPRPLFLWVHL